MPKGFCRHDEVISYLIKFQTLNNRMPTKKEAIYDLKTHRGTLDRILAALADNGRLTRLPSGIVPYGVTNCGQIQQSA